MPAPAHSSRPPLCRCCEPPSDCPRGHRSCSWVSGPTSSQEHYCLLLSPGTRPREHHSWVLSAGPTEAPIEPLALRNHWKAATISFWTIPNSQQTSSSTPLTGSLNYRPTGTPRIVTVTLRAPHLRASVSLGLSQRAAGCFPLFFSSRKTVNLSWPNVLDGDGCGKSSKKKRKTREKTFINVSASL